jgi:hypothetical protein
MLLATGNWQLASAPFVEQQTTNSKQQAASSKQPAASCFSLFNQP